MTLTVGIGATSTATDDDILGLLTGVLAGQGFSLDDVATVTTVDAKRAQLTGLCQARRWELVTHSADELAQVRVATTSAHTSSAVGTPSVAEAAARLHGELVVGKTSSDRVTVAVARQS